MAAQKPPTDLQFLLSVLRDGSLHTHADLLTRSLEERGRGLVVATRISELRKRGYNVVHERVPGSGSAYRLLGGTGDVGLPEPFPGQITIQEALEEVIHERH
jgi:hypothetical protein